MMQTVLHTPRLELVGCSEALLQAEGDDRAHFAALLNASVTDSWPPELYDDAARQYTLQALRATPRNEGWLMYYLVLSPAVGERVLIGLAGYKGAPADGAVEVGYGVLPEHQRRGYASEAVQALLQRAFADPRVERVLAETLPDLQPSIGVLEKAGFTLEGPGSEEGVIRFVLPRSQWQTL